MEQEKNSLIYKLLRFSFVYKTYQFLVIRKSTYKFIYQNIFKTDNTSIVLDCGCGPAQYRNLIKCSKYIGIDFNKKHIEMARKKFSNDTFYIDDILNFDFKKITGYSDVLLFGLLHHLNDSNAKELIKNLSNNLKDDGKIVSIDPVYMESRNIYISVANFIASKDQGNFVRTEKEYIKLIDPSIFRTETKIYDNLLRIPFHHNVMYIHND